MHHKSHFHEMHDKEIKLALTFWPERKFVMAIERCMWGTTEFIEGIVKDSPFKAGSTSNVHKLCVCESIIKTFPIVFVIVLHVGINSRPQSDVFYTTKC